MNKKRIAKSNKLVTDVTGEGTTGSEVSVCPSGSEFDPSEGLAQLTNLSPEDLLEEIRKAHDVHSRLWFRRAVALGAFSDREGLDGLNQRQRSAALRGVAAATGVKSGTLREDLRIHRELLKEHRDQLKSLACERLDRDFYVVACGAPDPWMALQEARGGKFTRAKFRAHVAALKGVEPRKKKSRFPPAVEQALGKARPLFPGETDEAILMRGLQLALAGAAKSPRTTASGTRAAAPAG